MLCALLSPSILQSWSSRSFRSRKRRILEKRRSCRNQIHCCELRSLARRHRTSTEVFFWWSLRIPAFNAKAVAKATNHNVVRQKLPDIQWMGLSNSMQFLRQEVLQRSLMPCLSLTLHRFSGEVLRFLSSVSLCPLESDS